MTNWKLHTSHVCPKYVEWCVLWRPTVISLPSSWLVSRSARWTLTKLFPSVPSLGTRLRTDSRELFISFVTIKSSYTMKALFYKKKNTNCFLWYFRLLVLPTRRMSTSTTISTHSLPSAGSTTAPRMLHACFLFWFNLLLRANVMIFAKGPKRRVWSRSRSRRKETSQQLSCCPRINSRNSPSSRAATLPNHSIEFKKTVFTAQQQAGLVKTAGQITLTDCVLIDDGQELSQLLKMGADDMVLWQLKLYENFPFGTDQALKLVESCNKKIVIGSGTAADLFKQEHLVARLKEKAADGGLYHSVKFDFGSFSSSEKEAFRHFLAGTYTQKLGLLGDHATFAATKAEVIQQLSKAYDQDDPDAETYDWPFDPLWISCLALSTKCTSPVTWRRRSSLLLLSSLSLLRLTLLLPPVELPNISLLRLVPPSPVQEFVRVFVVFSVPSRVTLTSWKFAVYWDWPLLLPVPSFPKASAWVLCIFCTFTNMSATALLWTSGFFDLPRAVATLLRGKSFTVVTRKWKLAKRVWQSCKSAYPTILECQILVRFRF